MTNIQAPRPAPKNKTALAARVRNAARAADLPEGRVQRQLGVMVVTELLGRVRSENGQQLFLVKGGSSIELRLGVASSRTSKDLDAVFRGDFSRMYDAARAVLAEGWDGFSAVVTPPEAINAPGLSAKPRRFKVKLSFAGQPWCTIPVEVSAAESKSANHPESVSPAALAHVGLPALGLPETSAVLCLPLNYQIAQKLHACTSEDPDGRANDRAHDLIIDVLLLWNLVPEKEHPAVRSACLDIFTSRAMHPWPPQLLPPAHWQRLYEAAYRTVLEPGHVPPMVQEAAAAVRDIVDVIDQAG
jgi:hypothetical protein